MGYELEAFSDEQLTADYIDWLVEERSIEIQRHFSRLWDYYSNPATEVLGNGITERKVNETGQCYIQAQEYGLPTRITGVNQFVQGGFFRFGNSDIQRKEVVIENDIGWRINATVDFLFGKQISFISRSPDEKKRAEIEAILKAVFLAGGGIGFLQDMAVLGSVYGFVDCLVRPGVEILKHISSSYQVVPLEVVLELAQNIDLELIEAPRALPILDENDYRKIKYYVQHFFQRKNELREKNSFFSRILSGVGHNRDNRQIVGVTEIISLDFWQRYENKKLVAQGQLPWGFLPVVHIQNIAQPFFYEGRSDVEPLMPLQDELNTRLSDRANRITFQSFKMYLGKGIEGFEKRPVSPGRMWYSDNPEASIEEFGGDSSAPSESLHIGEIREAMDKTSGVSPVVAGVLKNRIGNLTSAVALRLTLMGMLSKNERKRFTYGQGLKQICKMVLSILDTSNIYKSSKADREVEIVFPSPLPENLLEKLREAQIKLELGVSTEQVLKELGYESTK